jgi:AbiTii-like protein
LPGVASAGMSLLRDIQDGAIRTDTPVSVLLRQCLVLAARLQHEPLRDWAQLELNRYPADIPLPPYRPKITAQVLGNFSGPFGSGARNMNLPESVLPEDLRDDLFRVEVREGVAHIEGLVNSGENQFEMPWPADVVATYQEDFVESMNLVGARKVVPATLFLGVLSGIRDRIVQFALEIEALDPAAGEADPGTAPIEQAQVTQIFNQTFHGDNTAFAAAGHTVNQTQTTQVDTQAVRETADAFGISGQDRKALLAAIEQDGGQAGENTREWIDRLKGGAIAVGTGVTTQTAAAALLGVLGLS